MRYLSMLVLAVALAACSAGATSTEVPVPTPESTASHTASVDETTGASMDAESPTAASCQEAFDGLAGSDLQSMTDLDTLGDELDSTIGACPDVDEWVSKVEAELPLMDTSEVEAWLEARCHDSSTLGDTQVCAEIDNM